MLTAKERKKLLDPTTPFTTEVAIKLLQDAVDNHEKRCRVFNEKWFKKKVKKC